jgi:hypothetical protein
MVSVQVFTIAEVASPEFYEERLSLLCTFHLLDVELSSNSVSHIC